MRYVIEYLLRPFMDLFVSIGLSGMFVPIIVVLILWIINVPKHIYKRSITWRDWMGTVAVVMTIIASILAMVNE